MSSQTTQTGKTENVSPSLFLRLIVGLVSVSLVAIAVASIALYVRFKAKNSEFHEETLYTQAALIVDFLKEAPKGPVVLPPYIIDEFKANNGRYAVVTRNRKLLAASPGITAPLNAISTVKRRDFFTLQPNEAAAPYYGMSVRTATANGPLWVQVAFHAGSIIYDSVLEEFIQDIAWLWFPFVGVLLLVNLVVARIGLAPLRTAARQASAIGPAAVSMRLTEDGMPRDVYALVSAVNHGLDRLETAFDAQRRFIADAAHELRTPVAVLKAHMGVLSRFEGRDDLLQEVGTLERLVNQLLDVARLDVLELEADALADLVQVATEVVEDLGPVAIEQRRSIELIAPSQPVHIHGAHDYLVRALRNIIENALRHTPEGTTVSIAVTSNPPSLSVTDHGPGIRAEQREAIFSRFWQGGRDQKGGAGLGLDIVARTMAAHGGTISVSDAPGGGAVFTMLFVGDRAPEGSVVQSSVRQSTYVSDVA